MASTGDTGSLTIEILREAMLKIDDRPDPMGYPQLPSPVMLGGMNVYKSEHLTRRRQVRFPRSKRRRIQKKWRKRAGNWSVIPDPNMYVLYGHHLYGHPATIDNAMGLLAATRKAHRSVSRIGE